MTPRERDCVDRLSSGATNKEIARELGISPRTVHTLLGRAYKRMGVRNRTEAAIKMMKGTK
jgi:DNA-binding CsgD family transcriptional regulator